MAKEIIETYKAIPPIQIDLDTEDVTLISIADKVSSIVNRYMDLNPNIDIYSSMGLTQLLKTIHRRCTINVKDIEVLNRYWDIYVYLCCYCKIKPTLNRFAILIGVVPETITDWGKNERYMDEFGNSHSQSAKKWKSECEGALYDDVIKTGNIGCMFALKANYGYRDNVDITVTTKDAGSPKKSIEEIAADYGQQVVADRTQAPKIDF